MRLPRFSRLLAVAALASSALAASVPAREFELEDRASGTKYVFAHFIVGFVASYLQADWTADMQLAQAIGIDGFALDIGKDPYNAAQLGYAYAAAEALGFKVFLSFDFTYWNSSDTSTIASYISTYGPLPAQFTYNGDVFVSTFSGDGFDWAAVAAESKALYACPNYQASSFSTSSGVSCFLSWNAWSSSDNKPVDASMTTAGDVDYINTLGSDAYMMPISPWFFTHYGPGSYNKNWIFYADYQWTSRWEAALSLAPQFLEILTWNDFSESHYIGPLHPNKPSVYAGNTSTGAVEWVTGMPHDAWRDVAAVYIAAYKAGASAPTVKTEELVYYYRPNPKDATCSDSVAQPTGYDYDGDSIFVIAMTTSAGTVVINSGGVSTYIDVPAGITNVSAPMTVGVQSFSLTRDSGATVVMSGTSDLQVSSSCTVYNFNAYVGSVTA
ncbi:glycoside hydrolase family 71 protein [Athelia psychrophila]|uniref:Glycoside hydrolase family 71 protein n=1 Tax=Athelia psychrophila TaxID=1759441 RepID=A0A166L0A2_9AGAM|nr:glycoside hydrolase family 71 protein [Fibularhizoctonia sp. CBS 109695]